MRKVRTDKVRKAIQKSKVQRVLKNRLDAAKKRKLPVVTSDPDVPSSPFSSYTCERCHNDRNGYENHYCPPHQCTGCGCSGRAYTEGGFCDSCSREPAEDHK